MRPLFRVFLCFVVSISFVGVLSACQLTVEAGGSNIGHETESGDIYLGWHLFKRETKKDKEVYPVGGEHGKFSAIRLETSQAPVNIKKVVVVFGNGEKFRPKVAKKLAKNTKTRNIQLPGGKRKIRKVVIIARSTKKLLAKIEVLGVR
ncbi:hypothetical protein JYT22_00880 [Endomicrobium sp. AH-315-J14]|nr:hypothetical protein [Endomicrobium sp. AH-315-J14]